MDLDSQPFESETPLAFNLQAAQTAPAEDGGAERRRWNLRALSRTYVCDATTRRAGKISRRILLVQLFQKRVESFFVYFPRYVLFTILYILQSATRSPLSQSSLNASAVSTLLSSHF